MKGPNHGRTGAGSEPGTHEHEHRVHEHEPGRGAHEHRVPDSAHPHGADARQGHAHADDSAHGGHAHHHGSDHAEHHRAMIADFRRRFWISLVLSVPVLALSPMIQSWLGIRDVLAFRGDAWVILGLSTAIYFYGGWPFLKGLASELRERRPGMMTLVGLAISVAYFYSAAVVFGVPGVIFFWETATLIDLMLLGHWIEMRSVLGASTALESLVRLLPAEAHRVLQGGGTEDVAVTELGRGDRVVVKPGEKMPIDGVVVEGRTTVNEALVTGESRPVEKGEGDEIIGGSVNGESAITIEVRKTGDETYLAQVIELVRKAQQTRSRTQDLANRAALLLTFVAITAGAVTLAVWLVIGSEFPFALERTVTVMVIACPHALGLAVPLVVAVSTALSARSGLLIRDRTAFEKARDLQAVVFDKTGTLTEGRFGVTEIVSLGELAEDEILRLAASLESHSEHPIARGIVRSAEEKDIAFPAPTGFRAIPGKGAEAEVDGRGVKVVSPSWLRENDISLENTRVDEIAAEGKTVVYLFFEGRLEGAIALADVIRPESREAIRELREMGLRVMMLTGDSEAVARWVARELELDEFFAGVLPDKKAEKIREIQSRGLIVGMTGDGVNDAPALMQADVGIAIGAGTDVAIESAHIVLVRSDPRDVARVIDLARSTYRKMIQNLWWAAGYNAIAIPLAGGVLAWAGVVLSPAAGAVLMSLSTVIVAVNARLLGFRRGSEDARESERGGRAAREARR